MISCLSGFIRDHDSGHYTTSTGDKWDSVSPLFDWGSGNEARDHEEDQRKELSEHLAVELGETFETAVSRRRVKRLKVDHRSVRNKANVEANENECSALAGGKTIRCICSSSYRSQADRAMC
jgi:hypothetical protein